MHRLASSFILGFHGCDAKVRDQLLGGRDFEHSRNDYDWLGHGIYFWENNPRRGLEYATHLATSDYGPDVTKPAVVGAVIELGLCLDLMTSAGIDQVREAYRSFVKTVETAGHDLPRNEADGRRKLDCAVIEVLHGIRKVGDDTPVDTVRGVFTEGSELYPGAGFRAKTHIQVCVRNSDCIKGVFRVSDRLMDQF